MARWFLLLGGLNAFLSVALGAFGAHWLEGYLTERLLGVYRTGVSYQQAHALGLILIGLLAERWPQNRFLVWAGGLLTAGIVLFSGSLYGLALSGLRVLGAITPLGGLCFLLGWLLFCVAALRGEADRATG
jgi:uncharacterized membrane protein YgdD (TMEM256/DUF423 family)